MAKILIVDDDEALLESLVALFEDEGFQVRGLTNGSRLTQSILSFRPDLLLMDVMLPGKDGDELAKTIKSNPETRSLPVILMSAGENLIYRSRLCLANASISKPFDFDELLSLTHEHILNSIGLGP